MKYIKASSLYPNIKLINLNNLKMYGLGENKFIRNSWKQLYSELSGLRCRHPIKVGERINLITHKTRVRNYNEIL